MSDLLDHVDQRIRTRRLFHLGQRILVAVSGGVDSMVLLHLLHKLAPRHGWRLTVAHFNHQLRGRSSAADEQLVTNTAKRLRLPLTAGRAAVAKHAKRRKLSVEMAARQLRHDFLAQTARRRRIPVVALAHHADDQLELFFLRLLRGSGGEGLSGMKWSARSASDARVQLVRPLLDQPKSVLAEYAAIHNIRYREDASNAVMDFQRNRIRHELLPLLRRKYQPALDKTISRVMDILGAEAEFTAQAAEDWLAGLGNLKSKASNPGLQPDLTFNQLPVAVQRRCVQTQLLSLGIPPDYDLVEQLRTHAGQPVCFTERTTTKPTPRYVVRDSHGRVNLQVLIPEEFNPASAHLTLSEGRAGEVEFGGAAFRWRIRLSKTAPKPSPTAQTERFDADKVGSPIRLRHWRPGDRFQPIGMANPVKLQDLFTNLKVRRDERRQLIVAAAADGEIFWVEGLRISERFKLTNQTIRCLQWCWERL